MARENLSNRRGQLLLEFDFSGMGHTVGVGFYDDGRPSEIFLDCHKHGNALAENAHDGAVLTSLALQHGVPLATIANALNQELGGAASGVVGVALDALKADMPGLFEIPATEAPVSPTRDELLAENGTLHDEIAALSDELQKLKDLRDMTTVVIPSNITAEAYNEALLEHIRAPVGAYLEAGMILNRRCCCADKLLKDQVAELENGEPSHLKQIWLRNYRQVEYLKLAHSIWGSAALDRDERWRRFAEECIEAIQTRLDFDTFAEIAAYVYGRETGDPEQELGGVQTTLLALCAAEQWDADELEVREIRRVMAKDPNVMRAKHQAKVEAGVAMPGTPAISLLNACIDCPAPMTCTSENRCSKEHAEDHLYGKSCEPKTINTGTPETASFE